MQKVLQTSWPKMGLILLAIITTVGLCAGDVSHILNQNPVNINGNANLPQQIYWWMDKESPLRRAAESYQESAISAKTHALAENPFLNGRIHVSDVPNSGNQVDLPENPFFKSGPTRGKTSVHKIENPLISITNLGETGADINRLGGTSTVKPTRQALFSGPEYLPPVEGTHPVPSTLPPLRCAPGQQLIGGVCQCGGNTIFLNGQCLPSPTCGPNEYFQNGQCISRLPPTLPQCTAGQQLIGGVCQCVGNTIFQNGQCVPRPVPPPPQIICGSGQQLIGGVCQCIGNTVFQNGYCVPRPTIPPPPPTPIRCDIDEQLINGRCVRRPTLAPVIITTPIYLPPVPNCGPNQYLQNGQCITRPPPPPPIVPRCNYNEDVINGQCVPKPTPPPISCAPGQQLIGGVCQCLGNTIFQNGRCVAPPPTCPQGQQFIGGTCQCTGNTIFQNGRCVVPQPICAQGQQIIGGTCQCTGNTILQNGQCVPKATPPPPIPTPSQYLPPVDCAYNQVLQNGICVSKPTPAPICSGNTYLQNGVCVPRPTQLQCGPNQYNQNGICIPRPTAPVRPPTTPGYQYPKPTPVFTLPPQNVDDSNIQNIYISTVKPSTYRPDNIPSGDNNNPTFITPFQNNHHDQGPILPGCAAALKCVQEIYCTADGMISPVPVIFTKEQELFKVPVTDCADQEAGIVGKCCRDPYYKDPWPSANLVNGIDNGQYREDPNLGQYSKRQVKKSFR